MYRPCFLNSNTSLRFSIEVRTYFTWEIQHNWPDRYHRRCKRWSQQSLHSDCRATKDGQRQSLIMYVFCRTSLASRFVCSGRTERRKIQKDSLQLFDEQSFADVFPCQCRLHVFHCVNRGKQMALHDEINALQIIETGLDVVRRLRRSFEKTQWNLVTDGLSWLSRDP